MERHYLYGTLRPVKLSWPLNKIPYKSTYCICLFHFHKINAKSTIMLVLNILLILKLVFRHSRQRKQEDGTLRVAMKLEWCESWNEGKTERMMKEGSEIYGVSQGNTEESSIRRTRALIKGEMIKKKWKLYLSLSVIRE